MRRPERDRYRANGRPSAEKDGSRGELLLLYDRACSLRVREAVGGMVAFFSREAGEPDSEAFSAGGTSKTTSDERRHPLTLVSLSAKPEQPPNIPFYHCRRSRSSSSRATLKLHRRREKRASVEKTSKNMIVPCRQLVSRTSRVHLGCLRQTALITMQTKLDQVTKQTKTSEAVVKQY